MDTNQKVREQISAFADGELDDSQVDTILASLRRDESHQDWELYHRIGDVLRSDDMAAVSLRPDFTARMAARLEQEPIIIAPVTSSSTSKSNWKLAGKRWGLPGVAAAVAIASLAFVNMQNFVGGTDTGTDVSSQTVTAQVPEGVLLRDARIDDYLFAHQRFSPSLYSTAQYARAATFEADSNK